jgi:uncharacterized iron-regulated membrane protein
MKKKKKGQAKNIIRTIHLWLGLTSGLVVFIVALTGAMYVFEEEGREAFQHHYYHIPATDAPRVAVDRMVDTFTAHYPKDKITSIRFKETKDAAFVFFTEDRLVSIDPTTAQIIGVREKNKDFFTVIQKIHTELYLGEVGKQIVKWNVLIFFIMCLSGLILWLPKQWKFFRQASRVNWKTKNRKRLIWDLHSVFGFYALLVLFIISLTGLFWTFDTVKNMASLATTGKTFRKEEKMSIKPTGRFYQFSLQDAYAASEQSRPGAAETFITPSTKKEAVIKVIKRYPYSLLRKQNTLYYNANSGKLVAAELYDQYNGYDKVARANFDLHTGRIHALGIGSKIIYFLVALIAASLPITGFLVWWGRQKKNKAAIRKPAVLKVVKPEVEEQLS